MRKTSAGALVFKEVSMLLLLVAAALATAAPRPAPYPQTDATQPATEFRIDIDYSQTPELKDWVDTKLRPALETWYPIIVADLPSEGFVAPRHFTVTIDPSYGGIAATSGTHVVVSPKWIKDQEARGPMNESVGSVVHECVHVDQQYGGAAGRHRIPGYFTEGIADYIRWWKYEPAAMRHPVRAMRRNGQPASYRDSYQTTAAFLEYVARNVDHEIVVKLNATGRTGTYTPDFWKTYTGKSIDELWSEFAATLK